MSGIGALAGYGSDSDEEEQVQAVPSTVAAPATVPASKAPAKGGLFAALPPPSADNKRKHQIKLDSLADLRSQDDDDDRDGRRKKQAKSSAAPGPSSSSSSSSAHSLFGMLPAPTRKGPPTPPPREAPDEARMTIVETDDGGKEGRSGSGAAPKKGNADFRAMLGLKPVEKKAAAATAASGEGEGLAVPGTIARAASGSQSSSSSASSSNGKWSGSKQPSTQSRLPPATTKAPAQPPKSGPAPVDFFGLASSPSQPQPTVGPSRSSVSSTSISTISSAPSLTTNHDPYPGWAQNPDGSWIPVTPEAHEAFAIAQREQQQQQADAEAGGLDERQRQQLMAAGYADVDKLQSVDAAQAAALKRGGRPVDVGAGADAASAASRLDAKYAAAAAASKERAEGEEDDDEESSRGGPSSRGGGRDKLTNHRARGKGQLSSLFAQADEKRGDLEEKWARARENKRGAASRYGW